MTLLSENVVLSVVKITHGGTVRRDTNFIRETNIE
ncbi:hypothetical protein SAMN05444673_6763 [Bacillus sp. OV166]|nr:hypothetical protein SAMN05444673_6763 [Bacillus sp. OV166]